MHDRYCKCDRCGGNKISVAQTQTNTQIYVPVPGAKGDTPYIGVNGNWWVSGEDTGVSTQVASIITEFGDNV